ncbi:hypothetical protein GLAREA_04120 [Glarea lozoyensis ATCC 20868]|uniref:Heterokaryon incompatibility domain-containing protein n=1 Tax=Glarea lozoyensis (strain ATCC 20868 / MF5171) TaxID=1116229 RepID=S3DXR8_GLAL2|nr:uncharacterized protein GLAREA_04120 [Glarea lozoyensis ATCC 20868]EPE31153.1 hypothetical protein GLAREA_04120 [Glarea lozoyensis ATCC 20868]
MATKATLPSMLRGIQLEDIPKTFRVAISVTRQLGYQYLWIDALCVVQNSDSDKAEQISQITHIYRNAVFTISASRSASCNDGFLGPLDLDPENRPEVVSRKVPYSTFEGVVGRIQLRKFIPFDASVQTMHKRAWTYQEHCFSIRVLSFGSQVSWQCADGEALNFGILNDEISTLITMPKLSPAAIEDIMWNSIENSIKLTYKTILIENSEVGTLINKVAVKTARQVMGKRSLGKSVLTEDPNSNTVLKIVASKLLMKKLNKFKLYMVRVGMSEALSTNASDICEVIFDIFCDYFVRSFFGDRETRNLIQTMFAERDLAAILALLNPMLVRIFAIMMERSTVMPFRKDRNGESQAEVGGNGILGIIRASTTLLVDIQADALDMLEKIGIRFPRSKEEEEKDMLKLLPNLIAGLTLSPQIIKRVLVVKTHWPVVVERYSQRSLSDPSDRLPAISGIAIDFSKFTDGRYLAGLWERTFIHGLMWHQNHQVTSDSWLPLRPERQIRVFRPSACSYIAPSWSWAAADGLALYPKIQGKISQDLKVLGCDFYPENPGQPFGKVIGGSIRIRAPLRKVDHNWFTTSSTSYIKTYPDVQSRLAYILDREPDPWDYDSHVFWLLELFQSDGKYVENKHNSQGLVLEKLRDKVFMRVGIYKRANRGWVNTTKVLKWWEEGHSTVETIEII